jgi:hypothetical protein
VVSKLRRPFLFDRYFFIVVRLLRRREKFTQPDFARLTRAFNRARALHPYERCGLIDDRVTMPADPRARI